MKYIIGKMCQFYSDSSRFFFFFFSTNYRYLHQLKIRANVVLADLTIAIFSCHNFDIDPFSFKPQN
jgi:hypothetical protein